jgi:hypothetical protein
VIAVALFAFWQAALHMMAYEDCDGDHKNTLLCSSIASAAAKLASSCRSMPLVRFSRSTFLRLKPPLTRGFLSAREWQPKPSGLHRDPTAWLGMLDSNSEMSSQIIALKSSCRFPRIQPNSGRRDCSRLSCGVNNEGQLDHYRLF